MKTDNKKSNKKPAPKKGKDKNSKKAWQESHDPDFGRDDLWQYITMNPEGEFTYGFDDEADAKKYVAALKKRNRTLRIVPLDEALGMPFPPTYSQNWNFNKIYDIPKGLFTDENTNPA